MTQGAWIPEDGYGDRLRRVRSTLGLDIREMAETVMHSRSTYGRHEQARSPQDVQNAERLATLIEYKYGVPARWILTGDMSRGGTVIGEYQDKVELESPDTRGSLPTIAAILPHPAQFRRYLSADKAPRPTDRAPEAA